MALQQEKNLPKLSQREIMALVIKLLGTVMCLTRLMPAKDV